ncbi:signal transduction histidine kinase [Motilibacter rhizosphaerae]|uniref:histidine kinase n=1 Tax=Motilibacter rhizosphaerae TaxID=598652 RepID=A0A4Q7NU52_9ACTN|nr:sensor histidine kinase [Motilibacter rhizosphaerae]RZS90358.1 signal transduction histidine kinase [Motilibacter rhizosphaerae]
MAPPRTGRAADALAAAAVTVALAAAPDERARDDTRPSGPPSRTPLLAVVVLLAVLAASSFAVRSWALPVVLLLGAEAALVLVAARWSRPASASTAVLVLVVAGLLIPARPVSGGPQGDVLVLGEVVVAFSVLLAWTAGSSVRARDAYRTALQQQETAAAVAAERLRIARELHDVVAHSIGVIAIQAGVGSRVLDSRPEEARKALDAIEGTSREALRGLRRTLGTLREGDGTAAYAPVPGLRDLADLVGTARSTGLGVELEAHGLEQGLPAEVDLAAYRILQEALTNVARHSGGGTCRVRVEVALRRVLLEVRDPGPALAGREAGGYGLVGMQERVSALGGTLVAGPEGAGWCVRAELPVGRP